MIREATKDDIPAVLVVAYAAKKGPITPRFDGVFYMEIH